MAKTQAKETQTDSPKPVGTMGPHSGTKKAQPKKEENKEKESNLEKIYNEATSETETSTSQQDTSAKFDEEEMDRVKRIQRDYIEIQQGFGQISVAKIKLNQQLDALEKADTVLQGKFVEVQESEKKFVDHVTDKYGAGVLDPVTGDYVYTNNE